MSSFCADSSEQYCRPDNISIFAVEEINDEDLSERMVKVANDIGVTVSKQDISVCHRPPSRNPASRPVIAEFFQHETKTRVKTHKRIFET